MESLLEEEEEVKVVEEDVEEEEKEEDEADQKGPEAGPAEAEASLEDKKRMPTGGGQTTRRIRKWRTLPTQIQASQPQGE